MLDLAVSCRISKKIILLSMPICQYLFPVPPSPGPSPSGPGSCSRARKDVPKVWLLRKRTPRYMGEYNIWWEIVRNVAWVNKLYFVVVAVEKESFCKSFACESVFCDACKGRAFVSKRFAFIRPWNNHTFFFVINKTKCTQEICLWDSISSRFWYNLIKI